MLCTPHFLFFLPEEKEKTGRARSKREKEVRGVRYGGAPNDWRETGMTSPRRGATGAGGSRLGVFLFSLSLAWWVNRPGFPFSFSPFLFFSLFLSSSLHLLFICFSIDRSPCRGGPLCPPAPCCRNTPVERSPPCGALGGPSPLKRGRIRKGDFTRTKLLANRNLTVHLPCNPNNQLPHKQRSYWL